MDVNDQDPLNILIGEQLSAVIFVRDYVQLVFDGPGITAVTPAVVKAKGVAFGWGDVGYRDKLCEQIGNVVRCASIVENEAVTIEFDNDTAIIISLRPEDYVTPEAALFSYADHLWVW